MVNVTQLLPNPDTYLNHLPPDKAAQFEVVKIVQVASLGAIVWDIFSFIPEDVKVLKRGGGLVTLVCFVLTRLLAAVYMTFWVVMSTRPIANCQRVMLGSNIACFFLMAVTSFLFLRRAQAVFTGNRLAYWFFALLFTCSSASHIVPVFTMTLEHIPGTSYCVPSRGALPGLITYFMPEAFDTVVFFAVSYKIAYQDSQHRHDFVGNKFTRFFSSKSLPMLSRALLQGGQQYYLVSLILRLAAVILVFAPSLPPSYRSLLLLPSAIVTSSVACRVHRLMVLTYYNPNGETSAVYISGLRFAENDDPLAEKSLPHVIVDCNTPVNVDPQTQA